MRIVMCWGGVSGYMAACWRELASRPGVELLIFNFQGQSNTAFNEQLLAGLNYKFLPLDTPEPAAAIRKIILDHRADVVSVSGWLYPAYRELATDSQLRHIPMVMTMDTPLTRTWRQRLARFKVGSYLDRMSRVVVPGERSWQFARYLGVPEAKIRRSVYGIDYNALAPLHARRNAQPGGWPRRFLFTGRYVEEKGIDVLLEAYARYRKLSESPFALTCCGMGPLKGSFANGEGIEDLGFVQPAEMSDVMVRCGAFVLSSRFDPWPLVIVEACAAGLPVICTEACGSAVELVRNNYSGLTVATGDPEALARGLLWADRRYTELAAMGARAQNFAAAYSAQAWVDKWQHMLGEIVNAS